MPNIDIKKRILEVLERGHLMSLGTVDDQGVWVADVVYIHDENLTIYWMSAVSTRHSLAIHTNNNAAATITVSVKSKEPNLGIQCEGKAEKIEGQRPDLMRKHLLKRGNDISAPDAIKDIAPNRSWYKLVPSRIDLIDEENFGFKKQTIIF